MFKLSATYVTSVKRMTINYADPRVRKTRKGMREAFFTLLERQGYDSITIQDIADVAEIARITFYRHYRDKEELLLDCLNSLFDEILHRTPYNGKFVDIDTETPTRILFEHFRENEKLYKILLSSRGGEAAIARLRNYLVDKIIETFETVAQENRPNIPDELIAYHLVSAHIGLGIWWIENNKPYPMEYMIDIANWLSFAGAYRSLGFNESDLAIPEHPRKTK